MVGSQLVSLLGPASWLTSWLQVTRPGSVWNHCLC